MMIHLRSLAKLIQQWDTAFDDLESTIEATSNLITQQQRTFALFASCNPQSPLSSNMVANSRPLLVSDRVRQLYSDKQLREALKFKQTTALNKNVTKLCKSLSRLQKVVIELRQLNGQSMEEVVDTFPDSWAKDIQFQGPDDVRHVGISISKCLEWMSESVRMYSKEYERLAVVVTSRLGSDDLTMGQEESSSTLIQQMESWSTPKWIDQDVIKEFQSKLAQYEFINKKSNLS
jgi:uncharacterized protein (DUF433 family)